MNKHYLSKKRVLVYKIEDGKCSCGLDNCSGPGKHPIGGPNKTVKNHQHHDGGIGIALDDSTICVDVDPKNGGIESLKNLESTLGPLPKDTPRVVSGSGGYHIYLHKRNFPTANLNHFAPGVEIKVNGFLVCPPSPHASGQCYEWETSDDLALAEVPESWQLAFKNQSKLDVKDTGNCPKEEELPALADRITWARTSITQLPGSVAGSGGHDAAMKVAVQLVRGYCLPVNEALSLFQEVYNPKCIDGATGEQFPWEEKDIRHKLTDAEKKGIVPWGFAIRNTSSSWDLRTNKKGSPVRDAENLRQIFRQAPELSNIAWNERAGMVFLQLPQEVVDGPGDEKLRCLDDNDTNCIQTWIIQNCAVEWCASDVRAALIRAAVEKPFDELRDWLRGLEWDGISRVENWLHRYLGADDNPYTKEAGTIWLKGAVARVLTPGIQFDLAMIMEGDQGIGKTTALRVLAGNYHIETALELDRKGEDEIIRKLHGSESWIVEMSELTAFRKSEIESLKSFLTKTHDHYRKPYAREVTIKPRGFVFAGTTNDTTYLADSANRRYLPVRVEQLDKDALENDRKQLLAETVALYKADPRLTLAPEVWSFVEKERDSRRVVSVDEDIVKSFLAGRSVVRICELAELMYGDNYAGRATAGFSRRMGGYLRSEEFEPCYGKPTTGQRHVRMWRRAYLKNESEAGLWEVYTEERKTGETLDGSTQPVRDVLRRCQAAQSRADQIAPSASACS